MDIRWEHFPMEEEKAVGAELFRKRVEETEYERRQAALRRHREQDKEDLLLYQHRIAHLMLFLGMALVVYMGIGWTSGWDLPYFLLSVWAAVMVTFFLYVAPKYKGRGGSR